MDGVELIGVDEMVGRLERTLGTSPADATELVWVETGRAAATTGRRRGGEAPVRERTLLVRVVERGRVGVHVGEACEVRDLEGAVRQALGQARSGPPPAALPRLATAAEGGAARSGFDDELARLAPGDVGFLLQRLVERGETARLAWSVGRVAVVHSGGLRRSAEVTAATLTVRSGRGAGAGRAAGSARTLAALDAEAIAERARQRRAEGGPADDEGDEGEETGVGQIPRAGSAGGTAGRRKEPGTPTAGESRGETGGPEGSGAGNGTAPEARSPGPPVVLAAEGVARLLELLAVHALSTRSFRAGTSCLVGRLGERLFDPALRLVDDAGDPDGLPFPFDLFGFAAAPVELIAGGAARTPAVDPELAAALNRPPTPHAVAPDDARPTHLFLTPGSADEGGLLAAASSAATGGEGALWIGWLDDVVCDDPGVLRFRARARNVRRISDGVLGPIVGDLVWEDSLLRLLARVTALGAEPVCLAGGAGVFGAVSAPAIAFPATAARLEPPT